MNILFLIQKVWHVDNGGDYVCCPNSGDTVSDGAPNDASNHAGGLFTNGTAKIERRTKLGDPAKHKKVQIGRLGDK